MASNDNGLFCTGKLLLKGGHCSQIVSLRFLGSRQMNELLCLLVGISKLGSAKCQIQCMQAYRPGRLLFCWFQALFNCEKKRWRRNVEYATERLRELSGKRSGVVFITKIQFNNYKCILSNVHQLRWQFLHNKKIRFRRSYIGFQPLL